MNRLLSATFMRRSVFVIGGYTAARLYNFSPQNNGERNKLILPVSFVGGFVIEVLFDWKRIVSTSNCEGKKETILSFGRLNCCGEPKNAIILWDFDYWILLILNDAARQVSRLQIETNANPELYDKVFEANGLRAPPNLIRFVSPPDKFLKIFGIEELEKRYKPLHSNLTKSFQEFSVLQRASLVAFGTLHIETNLTQEIVDEDISDMNAIYDEIRSIFCKEMVELALKDSPNGEKLCKAFHSIAKERGIY